MFMPQSSMQLTAETSRQIADLARQWGLPEIRHTTAVVERAVALAYMLEVGCEEYRRRYREIVGEEL